MAFKRLFADFADKNHSDLWAELNRRIELAFASALDQLVKVQGSDTTSGYLLDKLQAGTGITLTPQNVGGNQTIEVAAPGSSTDELVKVSVADTTPAFLGSKVVNGANIAWTVLNPGANEQYRGDVTIPPQPDELVKVSAADTTPAFLGSKVVNGANIAWTVLNPGANEQYRGDVTIPPQPDELVKVSASDTTPGYLAAKLVAGTNVTLTPQNLGANESIRVDASSGGAAAWQNFVFVGKDGNDGTGLRNSLTNKFLTVQAALNAAQTGDAVFVGPGTYVENITWPSVDNVTLTSKWNAVIQSADGQIPVIGYSGVHSLQGVQIIDMQLVQIGTEGVPAATIHFDGSNVPGLTMMTSLPLLLWRVLAFTSAVVLRLSETGDVAIRDSFLQGEQYISQWGFVSLQTTKCEGTVDTSYVEASPHPPSAEGVVQFNHCEVDWLIPHEQARVRAYHTDFNTIYSTDLSDEATGPRIGYVRLFHCQWDAELNLSGLFQFADPLCCEAYNCHAGVASLTRIRGLTELNRARAIFRDTDFWTLVADGSDIDANQCQLQQSLTSAPAAGAIDRDVWLLPNVNVSASPGAPYAGAWIPYVAGGLTASAMVRSALGAVEFPVGVAPSGFTVGGSIAAAPGPVVADITILQVK